MLDLLVPLSLDLSCTSKYRGSNYLIYKGKHRMIILYKTKKCIKAKGRSINFRLPFARMNNNKQNNSMNQTANITNINK